MRILVVDDEKEILDRLKYVLEGEHYTVDTAIDGREALDHIWGDEYDLIVLDVMLPHIDGFNILTEIRKEKISTPVLMLTAKGSTEDKVEGLNLGADDYLVKPFSIAELLARVRALLRRAKSSSPILSSGSITLDTVSREVRRDGTLIQLTAREFSLLEFLLLNRGRAISRYSLAEHVWGDEFDLFSMSNFLDVHISNLRKKLGKQLIITMRGYGYRIN